MQRVSLKTYDKEAWESYWLMWKDSREQANWSFGIASEMRLHYLSTRLLCKQ